MEHKAAGAARASLRSKLNSGAMGSLALGHVANRGALTGGANHARPSALKVLQHNLLDFSEGE